MDGVEFLSDDSPESLLERLLLMRDVVPKGAVEQGLVVAAAGQLDLGLEPVHDLPVEPDRDPDLVGRRRKDGSAPS